MRAPGALLLAAIAATSLAALPVEAGVDTARREVQAAAAAVRAGDFATATDAYRRAIEAGAGSAELHYNWGTSALKAGRTGEAVLGLERAARLAPNDDDIAFNLERALERVDGDLGSVARTARAWSGVARLTLRQWQQLTLLLLAAVSLLLTARLALRRAPRLRVLLGWCALLAWLAAALASSGAVTRWQLARRGDAVLVGAGPCAALEAPEGGAPESFALAPGHRIQVIERSGGFVRVRLTNGLEGWVEQERVSPLETLGG